MTEADLQGTVVGRFRAVAAACPDVPAVRSGSDWLSFRELDQQARAVAAALLALDGPASRDPVAILLGHEASGIVAILGVMMAGRPCVPLDAVLPAARLAQIVTLAGAQVCVTDAAHLTDAAALPVTTTVDVGALPSPLDHLPERAGDDPVALLFTSGSTGEPKGVIWTSGTVLYNTWTLIDQLELRPGDRTPLFSTYAFAGGFLPALWALLAGAAVDMYDARVRGVRDLSRWLSDGRPTGLHATPSMIRAVGDVLAPGGMLPEVRYLVAFGEPPHARDVEAIRPYLPPAARFINAYGSSESGVATSYTVPLSDEVPPGALPAGHPLPGMEVRLEDPEGNLVPPGTSGELVIVAPYMSAGYWRQDDMTRTRFSRRDDGRYVYRSGDLGRLRPDGALVMLGRNDAAVKVRGYLVEPVEIEGALLASPDVADAVVVADRRTETVRLVAYVVPAPGTRPSPASIRRLLRATLPSYMVPATIVPMERLPRTERGKVDRQALPEPPAGPRLGQDPPRNQWEWAVGDLWARALNLEEVGVHDDFTDLGGDSLIAEELLAAVGEHLGVALPSSVIADAPTVAEFTQRVTGGRDADLSHPTFVPLQTGGSRTPLFCFAGAGGLAVTFLAFARRLGGDRPVYGLQANGLERRGWPDWTVGRAARRHAQLIRIVQPRGPYLLAGHSFGGMLAIETARILRGAGEEVAFLALLDSYPPGYTLADVPSSIMPSERPDVAPAADPGATRAVRLARLGADRLRQLAQLPLAGLVRFKGMAQYDVFFNQGRVLTRMHRLRPWPGRTVVYAVKGQDPDAWRKVLTGPSEVRVVAGEHDTILREPYVAVIAEDIARELDAVAF